MIRRRSDVPDVVEAVEARTAQAEALARIEGQARLADPRLNPALRPHADRLRDDQQRRALDAEHTRLVRRHRVADRRAAEAERTLEAIALARRTASPARSVLALHTGRRAWSRLAVAASVVLAAGSAMGVEAAAHHLAAPAGTGYVAEVGLTGLATAAITYRAHLAEHRGTLASGSWQSRSLWILMVVPMLVSVAANLATGNALGAACSLGAAAFALLGAVVADRSAEAMQDRAAEVDATDEAELRAVATGDDLATTAQAEAETAPGPERLLTKATMQAEVLEDLITAIAAGAAPGESSPGAERPELFSDEALARWLSEPPEAGGSISAPPPPAGGGPHGSAKTTPAVVDPAAAPRSQGVQIGAEQESGTGEVPRTGSAAAAEARRAQGEETRARVAAFLAAHPDATAVEIAAALGLGKTTVKRHRRDIRRERGEQS